MVVKLAYWMGIICFATGRERVQMAFSGASLVLAGSGLQRQGLPLQTNDEGLNLIFGGQAICQFCSLLATTKLSHLHPIPASSTG